MNIFELILTREGERIRVFASEKRKPTLKQYEDREVSFNKIDSLCSEVMSVLSRANRRGDIAESLITDLKKTGQDLFDQLLTPKAKELIRSTSLTTLSLEIDDRLVHIPWELLFDGGQFLCRRFSIGRTVSTRHPISGARHRTADSSMKMLIVADPAENLEAAYREGIRVRNELAGLEDRIKVNLVSTRVDRQYMGRNIRDYDIVHYSGHADFDENDPSKSGWVMSDGTWNAEDIKSIAGDRPLPFLVFANACKSGSTAGWHSEKGYEKEVYDLAGTFLHCGVTHYIGTFIEVLDSPGAAFAAEFYKSLSSGASVGEAVRIARERVVERYGETNIIWASYMLYGDPSYRIARELPEAEPKTYALSKVLTAISLLLIIAGIYFGVKEYRAPAAPPAADTPVPAVTIPEAAAPAPFRVSMMHMAGIREDTGASSGEAISEGSRLYVYDTFSFTFESNRNAWFYLLTTGRSGKAHLLFQGHGVQTDAPSPDTEYSISIEAHLFGLDDAPGIRAIYILASESKLDETEPVIWEIEKLHENQSAESAVFTQAPDSQLNYEIVAKIEVSDGRAAIIR